MLNVANTQPWPCNRVANRTDWGDTTGLWIAPAQAAPLRRSHRGATMADTALARVAAQPELDRIAKPLGEAVVAAYKNAGSVGMAVKNALHGVWLRHPLHPALIPIPLGAWTTVVALDAKAASSGDESYVRSEEHTSELQ